VPPVGMAARKCESLSVGGALEEAAEDGGSVFAELAVVRAEGGQEVGVDVEFADDFAVSEDRDDDFGLGFEGAGEVAGIGIDIIDDDGLAAGSRGATNALIEKDARVGRHGALEWAEDQDVVIALFLEHVEASPVVAGKFLVEQGDHAIHERFGGVRGARQGIELGDQVGWLCVCGGHGVRFTITGKRVSSPMRGFLCFSGACSRQSEIAPN